jgi:uncharacterized protein YebE (UPF0316 family)
MNKGIKYILIGLLAIFLIILGKQIIKQNHRDKHARYTIGITHGVFWGSKVHDNIKYAYWVMNHRYNCEDTYDYDNKAKQKGGSYFVLYDSINPKNSKLLQDFPVPDSIKTAPTNGWKEPPVEKQVSW